jgi:TonB family protein
MKLSHRLVGLLVTLALWVSGACAQKIDPKPIDTPSPGYPEALTDTGLSGAAEVDFTVKADGSVTSAELAMATHRAFGRAALAAVAAWKFQPGSLDGTPMERRVTVPFRFQAPVDQQLNASAKRKVFAEIPEAALSLKDFGGKLKVKKNARVIYPRSLAGSGTEEKVQVKFVVGPDGATFNPTVVGAKHKEFEFPAMQAVALMTYEPPKKDGKGVYVEMITTLEFTDERGEGGFGGGRGGRGGGGGGRGGGGFGGEGPGGN